MNWIRNFSYNNSIRRIAQIFRINNLLKRVYFFFFKPREGKLTLEIDGIRAHFFSNTPEQLRYWDVFSQKEFPILKFLLANLKKGEAVYDIGAGIGGYSIFIGKKIGKTGRVIACEPENVSYQIFLNNLRLNNLNNIISFQTALGDKFLLGMLGGGLGSFSLIKYREKARQKVRTVPGDFLIREKNLPPPNVINIDVEGYEYQVIKGFSESLSQDLCRLICCEVHPNMFPPGVTTEDILTLLKDLGFSPIKIFEQADVFYIFCHKEKKQLTKNFSIKNKL